MSIQTNQSRQNYGFSCLQIEAGQLNRIGAGNDCQLDRYLSIIIAIPMVGEGARFSLRR